MYCCVKGSQERPAATVTGHEVCARRGLRWLRIPTWFGATDLALPPSSPAVPTMSNERHTQRADRSAARPLFWEGHN